jgi:hypothetical protein
VARLRLHPLRELLLGGADAVDAVEELEQLRLLGGAVAEVRVDGVGDRVGIVDQDALDRVEVGPPLLDRGIRMLQLGGALQVENALRLVLDDLEMTELGGLSHGTFLLRDDCAETRRQRGI